MFLFVLQSMGKVLFGMFGVLVAVPQVATREINAFFGPYGVLASVPRVATEGRNAFGWYKIFGCSTWSGHWGEESLCHLGGSLVSSSSHHLFMGKLQPVSE